MNSFMKKNVATLLSTVMFFSVSPAVGVFAESSDMDDIIADVSYAYDYMDIGEQNAVFSAHDNASKATAAQITDSGINELMTSEFVKKFDGENAARTALVDLIAGTMSIHYSVNADEFASNAKTAENKIKAVLDTLQIGIGDWNDLVIGTLEDCQDIATINEKTIWATGSRAQVFETVEKLQLVAMNNLLDKNDALKSALDVYGWTAEKIMSAANAVSAAADSTRTAKYNLIKSAARSATKMYIDGELCRVDAALESVDWENNIKVFSQSELPKEATIQIEVMGHKRATNYAGYSTSNPDAVEFADVESDNEIVVTIKENAIGEIDIILKRDPAGDNSGSNADWILRQKILVYYDIETPNAPLWSDTKEGFIGWSEVPNATKYEVIIYKDDAEIENVWITQGNSFDVNDIMTQYGNGSYKAAVIAYGEREQEVSDMSSKSDAFTYDKSLETPNAPEWSNTTEGVIEWNEIPNATKYEVVIYKDGEEVAREVVAQGTSFSANSIIVGNGNGSYTATVKALGDGAYTPSEVSEESQPYTYTGALTAPNKPVLSEDAEGKKIVSWNTVDEATSYDVLLYLGNSEEPFETIPVTDLTNGTELDVTEYLEGMEGKIYAVVIAKNETNQSGMSEKSDPLDVWKTFSITGKAVLEGFDIYAPAGEVIIQENNAGIQVSIMELPKLGYTETDENGNYELPRVPNGSGYTIVYSHPTRPYMKKYVRESVRDEDVNVDVMLYYGETTNFDTDQINVNDIGPILPLLGSVSGDMIYIDEYDVNNDDAISGIELLVLIRNIGIEPVDL